MTKRNKLFFCLALAITLIGLLVWYLSTHNLAVINPAGQISRDERQLILIAVLLSAIVVVPVYILTILIVLKYRAGNETAKYNPDWDHSRILESIWWGVPLIIISILSVIAWNSAHKLDPFKPISNNAQPLTIQVVALDWKWLFIYPDKHVASVNQVEFPINHPINFYITSDTVMNSFWVPNLAGQIYAMPGMATQLHLIADKSGSYYGSSANISGSGFASMHFMAKAVSEDEFKTWSKNLSSVPTRLSMSAYNNLAQPSQNNQVSYYSRVSNDLFNSIIFKYMMPSGQGPNS